MKLSLENNLTKNFKTREFACKHCGEIIIDYSLVVRLQVVRDTFKKPIIINSGYRCLEHNKKVGGAVGSEHTKGRAVDIRPQNNKDLVELVRICEKIFNKNGIGYYKNFIHIDLGRKRRWNG